MNVVIVAFDKPLIFIQSRSMKCVNFPMCFAGQSGFGQMAISTSTSLFVVISELVVALQHGHFTGCASS